MAALTPAYLPCPIVDCDRVMVVTLTSKPGADGRSVDLNADTSDIQAHIAEHQAALA